MMDYLGYFSIYYKYHEKGAIPLPKNQDIFYKAQINSRRSIEIWVEPTDCKCEKKECKGKIQTKKGHVVLLQKIERFGKWKIDGFSEGLQIDGKRRVPAYTDPGWKGEPKNGPIKRGMRSPWHSSGYIDSPTTTGEVELKVEAWCRCFPFSSDYGPLAIRYISYSLYGGDDPTLK